VGESSRKLGTYLKRQFIEISPLKKLLYLLLVMVVVSFVMIALISVLFYFMLFVLVLVLLLLAELGIFFSRSVFDGTPKKPSIDSISYEFLFLFFAVLGLLVFSAPGSPKYTKLLLSVSFILFLSFVFLVFFIFLITKWIFPSAKSYNVKYKTAGRIFTYTSISTLWYLVIIAAVFLKLLKKPGKSLLSQIKLIFEHPTDWEIDWEIVSAIAFFLVLTIIFFAVKEFIFQYFGRKLASIKSKRFKNQKKALIDRVNKELDTIMGGEITDIDTIDKKIELWEKGIAYADQKVKKIEKEFEFHRSLKLTIVIPPLSIPISAVLAEILKLAFGM